MIFAYFGTDGRVIQAEKNQTVTTLPSGAFELTEEQFDRRFDLLLKNGKVTVSKNKPKKEDTDSVQKIRINNVKNQKSLGGVKISVGTTDIWVPTDVDSRMKYLYFFTLAGTGVNSDILKSNGSNIQIPTMTGTYLVLTVGNIKDIIFAIANLDCQLTLAQEAHNKGIDDSLDSEGYNYTTGWPETFEDIA